MAISADLEVLTLEEAAEFLRLPVDSVLQLARSDQLPGREVGDDWRFLEDALRDWLRGPSPREPVLRSAGAWKGDPHLDELLDGIYRRRGGMKPD